jgi:ubiquinone/menaquinone biosynthesis C-methylase UbiE
MDEAEFDKFAAEYSALHAANIKSSGESPEYFSEYKVRDVADYCALHGLIPTKILDFGAGTGGSVPYIRRHFPNSSLTCLDVSLKSLEIASHRFPNDAAFRHFDGEAIPLPNCSIDLAFAACVFHHIHEDEHIGLFHELRRVLTNSGRFFVFEHNPFNPLTVRAVNSCPFDENAVLIRATTLRDRLLAAGFSKVITQYRVFFPRALRLFRPIEPLLAWCPLGAQYSCVAEK